MSIRWILNGYFRSGTTFLWAVCRKALAPDSLCLYEPLHPDLAEHLSRQQADATVDRLHSQNLWSDYQRISPEYLNAILSLHPNWDRKVNWQLDALWQYLDSFNDLPDTVLLQTNRLHYELAPLADRYGARLVHVIRNPIAVFQSIRRSYFRSVGTFRRIVRMGRYPFQGGKAFETDGFYWKALNCLGREKVPGFHLGLLRKFVPAWVMANLESIRMIQEAGGLLIVYEDLVQNPRIAGEMLGGCLGLPVHIDSIDIRAALRTPEQSGFDVWKRLVAEWGLGDQMEEINEAVRTRGGHWW